MGSQRWVVLHWWPVIVVVFGDLVSGRCVSVAWLFPTQIKMMAMMIMMEWLLVMIAVVGELLAVPSVT